MATAILIILDGLGIGNAPDAAEYGDEGSNTLSNMAQAVGGIAVPTLESMGLGNLTSIQSVATTDSASALHGRLQEISAGKDSTTGHWELMGVVTENPYPTYPNGFPADLIAEFESRSGYGVIGNKAASGTEIIKELGEAHLETAKLIVYTSADSVFQVAAHDSICDIDELYRVCDIARELLQGEHCVSRVIARPFTGPVGDFQRMPYRRDYSVPPPEEMLLNRFQEAGVQVESIGKIFDLYDGHGINTSHPSKSNQEGMTQLEKVYREAYQGDRLLLLNLVDFDMLWGHRNDPLGMKQGLELFDAWLGQFIAQLKTGDLLMLTADHGNDPTMGSTDHSREMVPIIAYQKDKPGADIGIRKGFMDVGATFAEFFALDTLGPGQSFLVNDSTPSDANRNS